MRFEFKPSFDRSVGRFQGREKEEIKKVAIQAIDILSQKPVAEPIQEKSFSASPSAV